MEEFLADNAVIDDYVEGDGFSINEITEDGGAAVIENQSTGLQDGVHTAFGEADNIAASAVASEGDGDANVGQTKAFSERLNAMVAKREESLKQEYAPLLELVDTLRGLGYDGSPEEIKAAVAAQGLGITTEEYAQRQAEAQLIELGREALEKQKREAAESQLMRQHTEEFNQRFPSLSPSKVFEDKFFLSFAGDRLGRDSLAGLYEGYTAMKASLEQSLQARVGANMAASPGAVAGTPAEARRSVRDMTSAEFAAYKNKLFDE